ncbi:alpha/beta fold hydrolase [Caenimonas terrae]|uniref:Alpha/beta fold hydrolase n=1 Tax=Caenimonas terrae TaxID=696074 RepID=A0ABW0NET4_9BURK
MKLTVNGHDTFCYTGGKPFDAAKPTLVFIHGVLNDHSVWILQTRYFAHHGWNVLAPDLPGHCRSAGDPPRTVEDAAAFVLALLDAAGVQQAALVGHSFGSLAVLQAAATAPRRVSHLALLGTASPMKVSPALLDTSLNAPMQAIDMVNVFSHSLLAPPPSALGPGTWLYGGSKALMKRVLASNSEVNVFHRGFKACDDYRGAEAAMEKVKCPVLFILGRSDAMTLPRMAQPLIAKAPGAKVVTVEAGHQMMVEAPDAVLAALVGFLQP